MDATRNRVALVAAARTVFAESDEQGSLERIARDAGVGIGTLYRHFPTRQDLVAAVYEAELDAVLVAAAELRETLPADAAFRTWVDRYATFVATKRGMAESLRAGEFAAAATAAQTRARVTEAIGTFLDDGIAAGTLRDDVSADDITTALVGTFLATRDATDAKQAGRLIDVLFDGLRPQG
jgi:AcrR family transcriptional regulator